MPYEHINLVTAACNNNAMCRLNADLQIYQYNNNNVLVYIH